MKVEPIETADTDAERKMKDAELDVGSEQFNPLRALYAADFKVSQKQPKVHYQNLAAFESAFKRFGILKLNKRNPSQKTAAQPPTASDDTPSTSKAAASAQRPLILQDDAAAGQQRRFLPHQMAIRRADAETRGQRHKRNLYAQMAEATGPCAQLHAAIVGSRRVRVVMRREHGVRGSVEGRLLAFDKHWNLLLRDVHEVWQRRKYAYGENKSCAGEPQDCTWQLRQLGVVLPVTRVKSLNRKNVEIRRELAQLMVRGEQVVLVVLLPAVGEEQELVGKQQEKVGKKKCRV